MSKKKKKKKKKILVGPEGTEKIGCLPHFSTCLGKISRGISLQIPGRIGAPESRNA